MENTPLTEQDETMTARAARHSLCRRGRRPRPRRVMFTARDLFALMAPLAVEQALVMLVGVVDVAMISNVSEAAVSAVSLVDMMTYFFIVLFAALSAGGAVVVSQYLGARHLPLHEQNLSHHVRVPGRQHGERRRQRRGRIRAAGRHPGRGGSRALLPSVCAGVRVRGKVVPSLKPSGAPLASGAPRQKRSMMPRAPKEPKPNRAIHPPGRAGARWRIPRRPVQRPCAAYHASRRARSRPPASAPRV